MSKLYNATIEAETALQNALGFEGREFKEHYDEQIAEFGHSFTELSGLGTILGSAKIDAGTGEHYEHSFIRRADGSVLLVRESSEDEPEYWLMV